jgi:HD-GYP domain-containing protein (c-di-GMP phosphodiesterase class II)
MYEIDNGPLECLAALSQALDRGNGLGDDKSVLCAVFARDLADELGLGSGVRRVAGLAALLRHLGCTGFAPSEGLLAQDDIRLRRALMSAPSGQSGSALAALAQANTGWRARAAAGWQLLSEAGSLRAQWLNSACDAARVLAAEIGCPEAVLAALDQVFEQWDGRGGPAALAGEAIHAPARVAGAAHEAVLFWLAGGAGAARERLAAEAGRRLDPVIAARAASLVGRLDQAGYLARGVQALAADPASGLDAPVASVAATFGDFADLQSPFLQGHSRAVAAMAGRLAQALGLPPPVREALGLAAHLHDLGQVAVPTSLWLQPRAWRPAERERANAHVVVTARTLAQARPLAEAGRIAAGHHERLDGQGYPVGAGAAGLGAAARVLAVAEQACGLCEPRPQRPAHAPAAAAAMLARQARDGALDATAVDAAIAVLTGRAAPRGPGACPELLTEREYEVLVQLGAGLTNKQIARALGISDRTVQTHAVHLYAKLGVRTRAGATLVAVRRGWLASGADG